MPTSVLRLTFEDAHQLCNQLYDAGIEPAQGGGFTGQLEAVKFHLEDTRKLVFK